MKATVTLIILIALTLSASAEYRIWTNTKGYSVEAEFMGMKEGKVVLKNRDGKVYKLQPSSLCEQDRAHLKRTVKNFNEKVAASDQGNVLDQEKPPRLDIQFKKVTDTSRSGSSGHYRNTDMVCSIEIKKLNQEPYSGELKATLHIIGEDTYDKQFVILDTAERKFNFKNSKESSFESSHFTLKDCDCSSNHGTGYEGYLLVITDASGKLLEVKSNRSKYERARGMISSFERGQYFDKRFKKVKQVTTDTYY